MPARNQLNPLDAAAWERRAPWFTNGVMEAEARETGSKWTARLYSNSVSMSRVTDALALSR